MEPPFCSELRPSPVLSWPVVSNYSFRSPAKTVVENFHQQPGVIKSIKHCVTLFIATIITTAWNSTMSYSLQLVASMNTYTLCRHGHMLGSSFLFCLCCCLQIARGCEEQCRSSPRISMQSALQPEVRSGSTGNKNRTHRVTLMYRLR